MNLLKTKFRRTTAVVTGTLLGLAGVAAFAAPASAHSPLVAGSSDCVKSDGSWTVSWKIGNDFGADAKASDISAKDSSGKAVTVNITDPAHAIPPYTQPSSDQALAASTKITNSSATSVTLKTILLWSDGYTNNGDNWHAPVYTTVHKPEQKCDSTPSTPPSSPASPSSPTPTPSETPTLPVPTDAPNIFTPILEEDCTTMTIGADNPANGITWKFDLKTSKGEERSFTLKPGEKHTEKFSATAGFSIKVTISVTVNGKTISDYDTVKYEGPGNCTGGKGGGLPVTGTPTAAIAGGAVAVLALGAVLFFLARRRKVKFTA
ncbi:hypothetical protein [Actinoplanes subtropicus]|uniref:PVV-CTERM domain-containing choice-of-anchor G protein n=1 Tax=Actinoplanes subtropicus TaxID=543632 RepID=UPI0004C2C763|nr:hypothetical protein [Actinoplanes subtropicus]